MLRYACDTTNWLLQPNTLCHWNLRGKWSHSTWRMESGTNTTTLRFHKIQAQILKSSHNSKLDGHPGQEKILSHVNWSFMWPSMTAHVQKYINGCNSCQKVKSVAQRLFGTPERGLILGGGGMERHQLQVLLQGFCCLTGLIEYWEWLIGWQSHCVQMEVSHQFDHTSPPSF